MHDSIINIHIHPQAALRVVSNRMGGYLDVRHCPNGALKSFTIRGEWKLTELEGALVYFIATIGNNNYAYDFIRNTNISCDCYKGERFKIIERYGVSAEDAKVYIDHKATRKNKILLDYSTNSGGTAWIDECTSIDALLAIVAIVHDACLQAGEEPAVVESFCGVNEFTDKPTHRDEYLESVRYMLKMRAEIREKDFNKGKKVVKRVSPEVSKARAYEIFKEVVSGDSFKEVAARHGISSSRVHQIYDKEYMRFLRADLRLTNGGLRSIFTKEKYPKYWRDTSNTGTVKFDNCLIERKDLKTEKEAVIAIYGHFFPSMVK